MDPRSSSRAERFQSQQRERAALLGTRRLGTPLLGTPLLALLERRRELAGRVRAAEEAVHGTWRAERRRHWVTPADLAPVVPKVREVVRGPVLRSLLVELLEAIAGAARTLGPGEAGGAAGADELTVDELVQLLGQQGYGVTGRPSHTVSNALAVEVRAGRVVRVGRGRYRTPLPEEAGPAGGP